MLPKDYKYQLPDLHVWLVENGKDHGITCEFDDHKMALEFYKINYRYAKDVAVCLHRVGDDWLVDSSLPIRFNLPRSGKLKEIGW